MGKMMSNCNCARCRGSGIEEYWNHGHSEDSIEPIKCSVCDGFGYLDLLVTCGIFNPNDCISHEDMRHLFKVKEKRIDN